RVRVDEVRDTRLVVAPRIPPASQLREAPHLRREELGPSRVLRLDRPTARRMMRAQERHHPGFAETPRRDERAETAMLDAEECLAALVVQGAGGETIEMMLAALPEPVLASGRQSESARESSRRFPAPMRMDARFGNARHAAAPEVPVGRGSQQGE